MKWGLLADIAPQTDPTVPKNGNFATIFLATLALVQTSLYNDPRVFAQFVEAQARRSKSNPKVRTASERWRFIMKKLTLIVMALSVFGILMAGCTPPAEEGAGATTGADAGKTETKTEEGK